jgi:asparagine synthase (glutamine-hydrolysing)
MCGICGLAYSDQARSVEASRLEGMTRLLTHRGPDDEGYLLRGPVGLGMRRLSVIDIDGGGQPVPNEDGSIWTVFNGEIYNYRRLRADLGRRGHVFRSSSDTEVIVHAYEEYGNDVLLMLQGMFALAIWDARQPSLMLAVDRFGIKPLYYVPSASGIAFGSELTCLGPSGMLAQDIDFGALAEYFTLGYISAPRTIFAGNRKLSPGSFLLWTHEHGTVVRSYWDIPPRPTRSHRGVRETRHQLRECLREAVRSHLVSDVPLGAFLSGGIDSSTVVALMSEIGDEPVKTFSIGFSDRRYDERPFARMIAERFRTEHHELIVEPDTVQTLPRLVWHFGEPFSDPSSLPTYYVSQMARDYVKVALSGDGGDEVFVGYTMFRGLELARHFQALPEVLRRRISALLDLAQARATLQRSSSARGLTKRLSETSLPPREAYFRKLTTASSSSILPLLSADLSHRLQREDEYLAVKEALRSTCNDGYSLDTFIAAGSRLSLPNDMLVKVDRMSMANSLEVRVPLLDAALTEFVQSVPLSQLFPRWRLKGLLKDSMRDALPPAILRHAKQGFAVPLQAWFRESLRDFAKEVLLDRGASTGGYLDTIAIERVLNSHRPLEPGMYTAIWSLLVFQLWCDRMLETS